MKLSEFCNKQLEEAEGRVENSHEKNRGGRWWRNPSTPRKARLQEGRALKSGFRRGFSNTLLMNVISTSNTRQQLELNRAAIDAELDRILPPEAEYPSSIHKAMRYSVFAGGKRLRPTLCLEAGRLFGGEESVLLRVGSSLELIHTYSLIHDDLPALDNDDLRRGKPTSHVVFGEANAILAGDALLTLAFEAIAGAEGGSADRIVRVIYELAHAVGTVKGMVGGQVADLEASDSTGDAARLEYIHSAQDRSFYSHRAPRRSDSCRRETGRHCAHHVLRRKDRPGVSDRRRPARRTGLAG